MCLIKKRCFPVKAKEDIEVYKVLNLFRKETGEFVYRTAVVDYEVTLGKTIKSKYWFWLGLFKDTIEGEGVHSYEFEQHIYSMNYARISVKCIIPKGTWYYIGVDDELASQKLIVSELLEDPNEVYQDFLKEHLAQYQRVPITKSKSKKPTLKRIKKK